ELSRRRDQQHRQRTGTERGAGRERRDGHGRGRHAQLPVQRPDDGGRAARDAAVQPPERLERDAGAAHRAAERACPAVADAERHRHAAHLGGGVGGSDQRADPPDLDAAHADQPAAALPVVADGGRRHERLPGRHLHLVRHLRQVRAGGVGDGRDAGAGSGGHHPGPQRGAGRGHHRHPQPDHGERAGAERTAALVGHGGPAGERGADGLPRGRAAVRGLLQAARLRAALRHQPADGGLQLRRGIVVHPGRGGVHRLQGGAAGPGGHVHPLDGAAGGRGGGGRGHDQRHPLLVRRRGGPAQPRRPDPAGRRRSRRVVLRRLSRVQGRRVAAGQPLGDRPRRPPRRGSHGVSGRHQRQQPGQPAPHHDQPGRRVAGEPRHQHAPGRPVLHPPGAGRRLQRQGAARHELRDRYVPPERVLRQALRLFRRRVARRPGRHAVQPGQPERNQRPGGAPDLPLRDRGCAVHERQHPAERAAGERRAAVRLHELPGLLRAGGRHRLPLV
ncbi:MAG: hypothetical protein AVDCRST_MAG68-2300, partial [uncultured Gemmatimonadetes bacterium]